LSKYDSLNVSVITVIFHIKHVSVAIPHKIPSRDTQEKKGSVLITTDAFLAFLLLEALY